MSGDTDRLAVVRGWVEKAEHDLANAENTLRMRKGCPYDTVCFHSQQCVEKYLKALLASVGADIAYRHPIDLLMRDLPEGLRPPLSRTEQETLSAYAIDVRYPEPEAEPLSRAEAAAAVKIARKAREFCRSKLPPRAVRLKRQK